MICFSQLTSRINHKKSKNKTALNVSFALGASIAGITSMLLIKHCLLKSERPADSDDVAMKEAEGIKRKEIKETLESADAEAMGDVGVAMEKAINDLDTMP